MSLATPLYFTPEILFEKLKNIKVGNPLCSYTMQRCKHLAPIINEILELKAEKNALILAHSYVHPDIVYGIADHVGDSYGLAKQAMAATSDVIVFPAVRFMAETAKILNPAKTVIDPNPNGGCSLADSITYEEVLRLREKYPHHTFVCYINTTAAVKAACDVCVTSTNVYDIIEAIPNDKIYFLPDKLMAQNILSYLKQKKIDKELLFYSGTCYVHEEFSEEQIDLIKRSHPSVTVIAHPECKPEVANRADLVSSTTGMLDYVKNNASSDKLFLVLTECGVISRLQVECPDAKMVGTCMMCRYMKSNSLDSIKQALLDPLPSQIVEIDPDIQKQALKCLNSMFYYYCK
jgi:quinolinate synthase